MITIHIMRIMRIQLIHQVLFTWVKVFFLHTNVETSYGPVRATNGGFYRYNPQRRQLERTAQLAIPNPWGIAFDEWGAEFFC